MEDIQQTKKFIAEAVKFLDGNFKVDFEGHFIIRVITEKRMKAKQLELDLIHGGLKWALKKHLRIKTLEDYKLADSISRKWLRKQMKPLKK